MLHLILMKIIFIQLTIFFFYFSVFSQQINGVVLDKITGKPLELVTVVNINSQQTVFSNKNGRFILPCKSSDSLKISFVGYNSIKVLVNSLKKQDEVFYLHPVTFSLNEVFIKGREYGSAKNIKAKKNNEIEEYFGFQFGTEHVNYIENENHMAGKITSISLSLKKVGEHDSNIKEWKRDYISDFKISFYEYDRFNNKPRKQINEELIIVSPGNKTQTFSIDLESYNIDFPLDGICIGVEVYNSSYTNPKTTFAIIGPTIKFIEKTNFKNVQSWIRYNKPEIKDEFKKVEIDKKKKNWFYESMAIDIKVKFEK